MAVKAPEGTFDLLPDDVRFWDHFRQTAFEIFGRCGYQPIETPLFEQTDLFVRGIGPPMLFLKKCSLLFPVATWKSFLLVNR